MNVMYHKTSPSNIKSILEKGLLANEPKYGHITSKTKWMYAKGVYLSKKRNRACKYLALQIYINVDKLDLKTDLDEINAKNGSYYVEHDISAERIVRVTPYSFFELKGNEELKEIYDALIKRKGSPNPSKRKKVSPEPPSKKEKVVSDN